ncbi:hypothetical protein RF11_15855 [Thelohanellus kitauei]|uniref:Uncharacterized protein n=1 Tax=Thelohanellus kitauei TaxID=669202 RepID=A0A0C2M433_THEKT|nr:hypothetical protein RF11_15855 [Thelohanellus kitauei]
MLLISTAAVVLSPTLAILGYCSKRFRELSGFAIIGSAAFLGIFSLSYLGYLLFHAYNNSFIFTKNPLDIQFHGMHLKLPPMGFTLIIVLCITITLGYVILINRFNDYENIK